MKRLSIIVPVYNEEPTIRRLLSRILKVKVPRLITEIVIVDDGSTDKTGLLLSRIKNKRVIMVHHKTNCGKGAAIRTGLSIAKGDYLVIQDADLEYNPCEIPSLIAPLIDNYADVVFGSRFIGDKPKRALYYWHKVANFMITTLSNMLNNINLTDIETGYKAFTKKVSKSLNLKEDGFGFDPEFTAKVAKSRYKIYEVGISYDGRSYEEGKKIKLIDTLVVIKAILRYNLF